MKCLIVKINFSQNQYAILIFLHTAVSAFVCIPHTKSYILVRSVCIARIVSVLFVFCSVAHLKRSIGIKAQATKLSEPLFKPSVFSRFLVQCDFKLLMCESCSKVIRKQ